MNAASNYARVGLDKESIGKCLCVPWIIVFGSVGSVIGQRPQNTAPKIDRSAFERKSGPVPSKGSTGILADKCGSRVAEAELLSSSFTYSNGRVSVEVVKFPKGYGFVPHDLFGLLSKANNESITFRAWEYADGSQGGVVCSYSYGQDGQKQKGGVLWFHGNVEEGFETVIIGYNNLDGVPGIVVDDYLRKYPSDLPPDPTWHVDWHTKDLQKWANVLLANKEDVVMLQAGAAYLMRYDKLSFGLFDALRQSDNTASGSQALDAVIERLSQEAAKRRQESAQQPAQSDE